MTIDIGLTCRTNPFSTRYIAPHAAPYLFAGDENAQRPIARLAGLGWRGQIVGPHGSGKSTLVSTLLEPLAQAGRPAFVMALHDKQRHLMVDWVPQARAAGAGLIVVDGYEQLGRVARWALRWHCWRQGWGLLVTAHADVGLPTLATIAPNLGVAQAVVDRLLRRGGNSISRDVVAECFAASGGNVRETLFALYDRFEAARVR